MVIEKSKDAFLFQIPQILKMSISSSNTFNCVLNVLSVPKTTIHTCTQLNAHKTIPMSISWL